MASKSRLGKGLGALFPPLPDDSKESEQSEVKSAETIRANTPSNEQVSSQGSRKSTTSVAKSSSSEGTGSSKQQILRQRNTSVSRETSVAADHRKSLNDGAVQTANETESRETGKNGRRRRTAGNTHRANIPTWGELTHPSDVFFSGKPTILEEEIASSQVQHADTSPVPVHDSSPSMTADGSSNKSSSGNEPSSKATNQENNKVDDAHSSLTEVHGAYLADLPIAEVGPNAHQPRTIFDEDELNELADSIKQVGVLQPIVVRERQSYARTAPGSTSLPAELHSENAHQDTLGSIGSTPNRDDVADGVQQTEEQPTAAYSGSRYELIMGERRWRASQMAGLQTIPAIVKTTQDDDMLRDALLENLHRVNLNPLEEAAAYQQMIKEFGLTQGELSKAISKSRPQIANMLRLLNLPGSVQKKVAAGVLSAGHARALLGLNKTEEMDALASRIISEGLSVRSTEEIVAMKTAKTNTDKPAVSRSKSNPWTDSPIQHHLEDHFETQVAIRGNEKHGKIEIVFSSPDDMKRILGLLIPNQDANGHSGTTDGWI